MSESDDYQVIKSWRIWHLTPRGWIAGNYQEPDGSEVDIPAPADRVGTSRYSEVGSPMLGCKNEVTQVWLCKDKAKVAELVKKHGKTPKRLTP
jgi:hypothetical protein